MRKWRLTSAFYSEGRRQSHTELSLRAFRPRGSDNIGRLLSSELKTRRRRDSTTADLVEGAWGEVGVAMARKIALRKLTRLRVVVAPFPVEV